MVLGQQETGVPTWTRDLIRALARVDLENEYVVYHRKGLDKIAPEAGPKFCFVPVRLPGGGKAARVAWERFVLPRRVRREGIDVLHCPAYVAPRCVVPTVITLHDLFAFTRPRVCKRINVVHFRLLLPGSIRRAAVVHCTSRWVRGGLRQLFPQADARAIVVAPGVADIFRRPDPAEVARYRSERGLQEPPLLFVGNPEPKKGLANLLAAMARFVERRRAEAPQAPERKLVLVGPEGWPSEELDRHVAELGLAEHVVRWGYVPREEMPLVYGSALALVFPSEIEGFGLPPLEAMACGTPVITTGRGGLADCVGRAALLVADLSAAALAQAMAQIDSDEDLRRHLSDAGVQRARRFKWDEIARRMVAIYRVASRTPGPTVSVEALARAESAWLTAEGRS